MQVGAVNASVPSFKSNVVKNQEEFDEMVSSLSTLEDTVSITRKQADKKNALEIVASIAAGALVMAGATQLFVGKCIDIPLFSKLPELMEKAFKGISSQSAKLSTTLQGSDKGVLKFLGSGISNVDNFAKNIYKTKLKGIDGTASKAFVKLSSIGGAIFGTKALVEADGNGDGVADIAQKSQNAYGAMLKNAEAMNTLVKILA